MKYYIDSIFFPLVNSSKFFHDWHVFFSFFLHPTVLQLFAISLISSKVSHANGVLCTTNGCSRYSRGCGIFGKLCKICERPNRCKHGLGLLNNCRCGARGFRGLGELFFFVVFGKKNSLYNFINFLELLIYESSDKINHLVLI